MLFTKMTKYFSREDVTCQTVASSHCTAIAVSFIPLSYSVCGFLFVFCCLFFKYTNTCVPCV